jgi:hypothetical protein
VVLDVQRLADTVVDRRSVDLAAPGSALDRGERREVVQFDGGVRAADAATGPGASLERPGTKALTPPRRRGVRHR